MSDTDEMEEPRALARELAAAWRRTGEVPAEIDRAVLGAARWRLASRRPLVRLGSALAGAASLAAAVLVLMLARDGRTARDETRPTAAALAPFDVDSDGRVDVVDALIVARAADGRAGARIEPQWDFDGDERVGRGDVDLVLAEAVRIVR